MAKKREIKSADRICNLRPSPNTELDWSLEIAVRVGAISRPKAKLPESVDLRAGWWRINDQKLTGSCVGWAVADGVARYHFVKAGKIADTEMLSPRCTWMAAKETDEFRNRPESYIESGGTSIKSALNILKSFGAALESDVPFEIPNWLYRSDGDFLYADMAKRRVASYYNLRKDFKKWRTWLATQGPIVIGFDVDRSWDNATATKGELDKFESPTRGGHVALVVGYRKDGRFIIRNSWWTGWGDQGFAYASEAYLKKVLWNEGYGVTL